MILVLSGTEDGKKIAERLFNSGKKFITSVATEYGKSIFERMGLGSVCIQGRLDRDNLERLIDEKNINMIVDATHPYAANVSINAIDACKTKNKKYVRFQRAKTTIPDSTLIRRVYDIDGAISICRELGKRIMLTTGFNNLKDFVVLQEDGIEIVARILPMAEHIKKCVEMGITASNIVALQGPFSFELNVALYSHFKIDTMVTKDSGKEGGVVEKVEAAIDNGINVVLVDRPQISYPCVYSSIDEIVNLFM